MREAESGSFMRGYRPNGVATRFLDHERFWMILGTLRAAKTRVRSNTGGVDVTLSVLKR